MSNIFLMLGVANSNEKGKGLSVMQIEENAKRKNLKKTSPKRQLKLSTDEVELIRKLDKTLPRKEIFAKYVEGKMTYLGMCSILNYVSRVNG